MTTRPSIALALLLATAPSAIARSAPSAPQEVQIATREVPPFAMQDEAGQWHGLAIGLWDLIADRLSLEPTYRAVSLSEMLEGTATGEFDAAVGALTVTAEREQTLDFSHPFLSSGLGIAVASSGAGSFLGVLSQLVSPAFLQVVAALAALLLLCGVLVWWFERRANAEEFGGSVLRGVGSGFWWSAVTMTTVGYGDKSPRTLGGRVVGLLWMFAGIIVISSFTAAIASSLTVDRLGTSIQGPDDLPGKRVGTVAESTGDAWTRRRFLSAETYPTAGEALRALAGGELDAVIYDAPVLRHLVRTQHGGTISVLPGHVERQDYAIALPEESELRESVNQAVLELTASAEWDRTLERYFGR